MPFTSELYKAILTSNERENVQRAYYRCCELLETQPDSYEQETLLAQFVLRAFEDSLQDPELAAQRVFEMVRKLH
ncbi:hypothetical protein [Ochrobactrum sp. BTU1]|jgi:hypothetical protein|uniref:hypothetical protein n=1 Tax=Ochrobactrum sp. BTU1 TaxID=2840456 RepID=UPI001C04AA51|nr:hypothetical protein KMS41_24795 [Ochrobactrum sp. BTU1]